MLTLRSYVTVSYFVSVIGSPWDSSLKGLSDPDKLC